jgi:hypothetical protein
MDQEFQPHPVLVNYEASRDGVVRNRRLKKPVGFPNNMGYLLFSVGTKSYLIHRIVYESFHGLIEPGLVIDHIDGCRQNNELSNLQAITQRENSIKGNTGNNPKQARSIDAFDTTTNEIKRFQSMCAAGRYFDIHRSSIRSVATGITRTALSKRTGHRIQFSFIIA